MPSPSPTPGSPRSTTGCAGATPTAGEVRLEAALGGVAGSPADLLDHRDARRRGRARDRAHHPLPRPPARRRRPAPPARHLGGRRRRRAEPARGGRRGARPPRVAAPRGPHRRRARRRRRDGPAALAAALGRHRRRRRPGPPRPVGPAARRHAAACAGRLLVPATPGASDLDQRAGVDLVHDLPTATGWVCGLPGSLVLGNYVYADGATNVRVSTAVDALTETVRPARPDTAMSFLATPTDVFAVPGRGRRRLGPGLRRPAHVEGAARAAAHPVGRSPAAPQLRARRGPRHQRLGRAPAGPQLPARQAPPALAGDLGPGPGRHGVVQDRPAHPHPLGREEPRARRGLRRRAPLRRRGVRARARPTP